MLKAHVEITKELWAKAQLEEKLFSHIKDEIEVNIYRYGLILFTLYLADKLFIQIEWSLSHFLVLIICCALDVLWGYTGWRKSIVETSRTFSFHAALDDDGVEIQHAKQRIPWASYESIKEYEDYYLIRGENGLSILPKTPELHEVIEFAKQRILNK